MVTQFLEPDQCWFELRSLATRAGVSVEQLCATVESATEFARDSVQAYKGGANLPYPTYDEDLEAVVRGLWDDDFEWEIKQVPWIENEHPRDERGRFTSGGSAGNSAQSSQGDASITYEELILPSVPAHRYSPPNRVMNAKEARDRLKEVDKKLKAKRDAWIEKHRLSGEKRRRAQEHLDALNKTNTSGFSDAQLTALLEQVEMVGVQVERYNQIEVRERQDIAELRKVLYVADPTTINFHFAAHPDFAGKAVPISSEHHKKAAEAGVEEVRRMVSAELKINDIYFEQETNPHLRSNYPGQGRIRMAGEAGTRLVVHEFGHDLEARNPHIRTAAINFLRRRTRGEQTLSLNDVSSSYKKSEKYRKDKFINPYMGKIYDNLSATEIFSMGLEYFHSDPMALAELDPDYFDFIYSSLRPLGRP